MGRDRMMIKRNAEEKIVLNRDKNDKYRFWIGHCIKSNRNRNEMQRHKREIIQMSLKIDDFSIVKYSRNYIFM